MFVIPRQKTSLAWGQGGGLNSKSMSYGAKNIKIKKLPRSQVIVDLNKILIFLR